MKHPLLLFFHQYADVLDKTQIGDYLGNESDFCKRVMYAYVDQLDFHHTEFDEAIRKFVNGFRLPGEAQKIDRLMEKFAEQYCKHNPGIFASADTAYVLAYAVIMLNTDAHSNQVKKKMTKEEFLRNNRGIEDGKDVNPVFMGEIYDRITQNEIKMKDDEIRAEAEKAASSRSDPRRRNNIFLKESQQMVKRTQELIKRQQQRAKQLANVGTGKMETPHVTINTEEKTSDMNGNEEAETTATENGHKETSVKDEMTKSFYTATYLDVEAVRPMFEIVWYPALATLSVLLEESDTERVIDLCLDGYRYAIRVCAAFNIETSRVAFVNSLKKFTLLGSTREMKPKNADAIKMLLQISYTEGNHLRESWVEILQCISEIERLHLIGSGTRPNVDVFQISPIRVTPQPQRPAITNMNRGQNDATNAQAVHKVLVDSSLIERVFQQSAYLNSNAIVDFVNALRLVSEQELSNVTNPRVFSLQKIVEITYYNMGRIRLVWSKIWAILSEYFMKAGCHPNLNVSMYAVDSLRQLAMKFLEKDELANYQFQKQFFKPFEHIMIHNPSPETRELIVGCLSRMILARVNNIKSGWKGVFVVLTSAAKDQHAALCTAAFDLVHNIMNKYWHLITDTADTIDECVNCLVSFGCNQFTEISLPSIDYLLRCAQFLGQAHLQKDVPSSPVLTAGSIASPPPSADENPEIRTAIDERSASAKANLKVWFLVLTGLSRMIGDPRMEVRSRALSALFDILHSHGHVFTQSTWRAIFHGVLFPIFDDIRHTDDHKRKTRATPATTTSTPSHRTSVTTSNDGPQSARGPGGYNKPPVPRVRPTTGSSAGAAATATATTPSQTPVGQLDQSWLQTTCLTALTTLVELFARFHARVSFLMRDLLQLLNNCIDQESEELSRMGIKCLIILFHHTGSQLSDEEWNGVIDAMNDIINRTLPHQLMSPRLRALLQLPVPTTNGVTASPASTTKTLAAPVPVIATPAPTPAPAAAPTPSPAPVPAPTAAPTDASVDSTAATATAAVPTETTAATSTTTSAPTDAETSPTTASPSSTSAEAGSEAAQESPSPTVTIPTSQPAASPSPALVPPTPTPAPAPAPVSPHPAASPSPSPAPVTAPSGPIILPFNPGVIHTKCKVQLLLMDAIYDIILMFFPVRQFSHPHHTDRKGRVYKTVHIRPSAIPASSWVPDADEQKRGPVRGYMSYSHVVALLDTITTSLEFARAFNHDIALRRKLYAAGFYNEQSTRLPQLFYQEAHAIKLTLQILFRMYSDDNDEDEVERDTATEITSSSNDDAERELEHSHILTAERRWYEMSERILTEYVAKTQAGQLVALECMDDVLCTWLTTATDLSHHQFLRLLSSFYSRCTDLIEYGSPPIRATLSRFFARVGTVIPGINTGKTTFNTTTSAAPTTATTTNTTTAPSTDNTAPTSPTSTSTSTSASASLSDS